MSDEDKKRQEEELEETNYDDNEDDEENENDDEDDDEDYEDENEDDEEDEDEDDEEDLEEEIEDSEEALEDDQELLADAEQSRGQPTPLKKVDAASLPVHVRIEVGSVKLPLEKLLSLSPGTILDTQGSPELSVRLIVDDQVVGEGELIKIGDTIAVRVTHLGT